jgi:hypothetical protein
MPKIILAAVGRITTHFHEDIGRGFLHRGIDQGHGDGTTADLEIRAPADGLVTFAGPFGSYGNVLFITHNDGWVSVLAHHARQLVSKGDRVTQRQIVAVMGNSGTVYVHNHQELRDAQANQVDPLLHLDSGSASAGSGTTTPLEDPDMAFDTDAAAALLAARDEARAANGNIVKALEGIAYIGSVVANILNNQGKEVPAQLQVSLDGIAQAVQDEADRRERARLAQQL